MELGSRLENGFVPAFYERFAIPDSDFWQLRG